MTDSRPSGDGNGWGRYFASLEKQLAEMRGDVRESTRQMSELREEVAALKTKAAIWGSMAAMVVSMAFAIAMKFLGE